MKKHSFSGACRYCQGRLIIIIKLSKVIQRLRIFPVLIISALNKKAAASDETAA
ncbi:hypothetical protein IE985_06600 [Klebsiella pneumoniae]|nr:hypothetical protein [Klebsiella pneumoniae]